MIHTDGNPKLWLSDAGKLQEKFWNCWLCLQNYFLGKIMQSNLQEAVMRKTSHQMGWMGLVTTLSPPPSNWGHILGQKSAHNHLILIISLTLQFIWWWLFLKLPTNVCFLWFPNSHSIKLKRHVIFSQCIILVKRLIAQNDNTFFVSEFLLSILKDTWHIFVWHRIFIFWQTPFIYANWANWSLYTLPGRSHTLPEFQISVASRLASLF